MATRAPTMQAQSPSPNGGASIEPRSPVQMPPGADGFRTEEAGRPADLTGAQMALAANPGGAEARPMLQPPPANEAVRATASTWLNNQRVNALWCINQDRNSWTSFAAGGWKRLANNSSSAITAMTLLVGHAKQAQGAVSYREEADGMVHEMYIW